jgi:hypothetical protein
MGHVFCGNGMMIDPSTHHNTFLFSNTFLYVSGVDVETFHLGLELETLHIDIGSTVLTYRCCGTFNVMMMDQILDPHVVSKE